jgi:chorismate-pyruvate lyase
MVAESLGKKDFGRGMLAKFGELERRSGVRLEIPQKILLAETGTLEQVLSILAAENIEVKVTQQAERGGIISRKSAIATSSGRELVRAQSKIFARNLPRQVVDLIRAKDRGIGSIIQGLEVESFRRITQIGYDPRSTNLFRKYQIKIAGKVAFEIREEFLK